jgi:hypothetical protein
MLTIQRTARFFGASLVVCTTLTQCAWFIPAEKSVPRYNKVIGEPRRPELNAVGGGAALVPAVAEGQMQPLAADAPPAPSAAAPVYPPVSDATKVRADEIVSRDVPPPLAASTESVRRTPAENLSAGGLAVAASAYPVLNSIPPSASVDPQSAARLDRVRAQLEQERSATNAQRLQLGSDAAAEPSLLRDTPNPALSVPVPPTVTPSGSSSLPLPPAPLARAEGMSRYVPQAVPSIPSPVSSAPVATNQRFAISPVPQRVEMPVQEPIILRAPAAIAPAAVAVGGEAKSSASSMPPAMPGGFNPLAGATAMPASQNYSASSYLPPSRYTQRRIY